MTIKIFVQVYFFPNKITSDYLAERKLCVVVMLTHECTEEHAVRAKLWVGCCPGPLEAARMQRVGLQIAICYYCILW